MTQNRSKAAMRYAARLTCIYDWTQGDMNRIPERLSRGDCLEAINHLGRDDNELAMKLWSIVGDMFPGTGNKDIEEAEKWIIPELVKAYSQQRREIITVQRLREVFYAEGITMRELQDQTGEPYVNFMRWTRFQTHVPELIVQAVESLDSTKTDWKTADVFRERDRIRRGYENAARAEKG